jgi:hypothetical protein
VIPFEHEDRLLNSFLVLNFVYYFEKVFPFVKTGLCAKEILTQSNI